jgi:hypothetical protein
MHPAGLAASRAADALQHVEVASTDTKPVDHLAGCSAALASLRPRHRQAALDAVAAGRLTPSDAMANVDAVRLLDHQAHHAWLAVAYLAGVAV